MAQYVGSEAEVGDGITLRQTSEFPWSGDVEVTVDVEEPATFGVNLRVPEWCREFRITVDDDSVRPPVANGFARVVREWTGGERIAVTFEMAVERTAPTRRSRRTSDASCYGGDRWCTVSRASTTTAARSLRADRRVAGGHLRF